MAYSKLYVYMLLENVYVAPLIAITNCQWVSAQLHEYIWHCIIIIEKS